MKKQHGSRIRAIFFDIDGTLVSFNTHAMPESTEKALFALRRKGIRVYVATGRSKMMMPFMDRYFSFDAYLTLNGQYCYDRTGVIRKETIHPGDIVRLKELIGRRPFSCLFVEEHRMFLNRRDETVERLCSLIDQPLPEIRGLDSVDENEIIQFVPFLKTGEEALLTDALENIEITRSVPFCVDVLPAGGGKQAGVAAVLRYAGIAPEETMAFGDGFNDVAMLEQAGIGVAMGNADPAVRERADYVTKTVDEGGIASALRHFGVLD